MKLKIRIAGPKVHDVGYRYFLATTAFNSGIQGFSAINLETDGLQVVEAVAEGDDDSIASFKEAVNTRKPKHSEVSDIAFFDYSGSIGPITGYLMICSVNQMNKAIPVLLDVRDSVMGIRDGVNDVKKGVNEVRDVVMDIRDDVKAVRENTDSTPEILNEIKDLREDLRSKHETRLIRIEKDVRAVKSKMGLAR